MKTFIKLALAGTALAAGVANAQINVPPTASGGSDLILFVTDTANGQTFVQDLGVNLDSLGVTTASVVADSNAGNSYSLFGNITNPGPLGSGGAITVGAGLINSTTHVDSALAAFEAANSGGTFYYTIMAGANGDGSVNAGQGRLLAAYTSANGATQFNDEPGSAGINSAVSNTTAFFAQSNAGTAVYDYTAGLGKQAVTSFGQTSGGNGSAIGGTTFLYEMATFGSGNDANVYASTDAITVGLGGVITGLVSAGSGSVPLPAAFWLLGSGVLGLLGIGRRRNAAVAA
ncbi:MAG: hypothetical protein JSS29_12140 [Proteobacteria bacterium]|nr:hypothetical protein [Pseudomonadota bacterium]